VRGATGLYHFAVLVPSRVELARSLRRLVETDTVMQGFADHGVSEALYLADPDGNGIEIYRDRPRADWPFTGGRLRMGTDPLFIAAGGYHHHIGLNTWAGIGAPPPPAGAIGLRHFEVRLPEEAALREVEQRLRAAHVAVDAANMHLWVRDPAQNLILLTSRP